MNIVAVILAAGYSSRMGAFKPLLRLGDSTAVERAVHCFLRVGVLDVRVVAGYRAKDLLAVVKPLQARVILNPDFGRGMYSSVQAAVGTLEPEIEAFFILPVDNPLVSSETVQKMLESYRSSAHKIIYPVFGGLRGHPPLIWAGYKEEIMRQVHPDGLRGVLNRHECDALDLAVSDEAVLLEMDTLEEYHNLLHYLEHPHAPSLGESLSLLGELQPRDEIREHCKVVAALACLLVRWLNCARAGLDDSLVRAGALLHDLARHEKNHALFAAELLKIQGYPRVAGIVASHMDMEINQEEPISEAEIVFFADKMVDGKKVVSLSERFSSRLVRFKDDPCAGDAVLRRLEQARQIKKKVERLVERSLEKIKTEDLNSVLKEWEGNK